MQIYIANNGVKEGPFTSFNELKGKISPDTLVWWNGLKQWESASNRSELAHLLIKNQTTPMPKQNTVAVTNNYSNQSVETKDKTNIYIGSGVVLVIILLSAYFFYFKEYFAYQKVVSDKMVSSCENYYRNYPNGRYTEDVKFLELEIDTKITKVRTFLNEYKESKYYSKAIAMKDNLWKSEIEKYEQSIKNNQNADTKSIQFFIGLLTYMKNNNESNIKVKFTQDVALNDWKDYSNDIRERLDEFYEENGNGKVTPKVVEVKSNFSTSSLENYESNTISAIQTNFNTIFSKDFVNVVSSNNQKDEKKENQALVINIRYQIKNAMMKYPDQKYPSVWTYTVNGKFISYVLAIDMYFDFQFKIPNSSEQFSYQEDANPGDNISGIENITDGYKQMTRISFDKFAKNISNKFGFEDKNNNEKK